MEQRDAEQTFGVGLIYGPSGCGKSSLVKAGLIPHLDKSIVAIYLEATAEDTEARILRPLRKAFPELGSVGDLSSSIVSLRRHLSESPQRKVLIIIDQFEQWVHVHSADPATEMVKALRQCDGGNVQAIVMIRDDFAMAAARVIKALDIPIVQGDNFATVGLFDAGPLFRNGQGQTLDTADARAGGRNSRDRCPFP